ncbi:MAG: FmdE family protein, partial [Bilophila sp.]
MNIGQWTHDAFMEEARKFHGYPAPGLIVGGYMVELAKQQMPEGTLYDAISETAHCLPDAVQLLTPCTYGNGWLRVLPFGIYAVSLYDKHTGAGVRVHLDNTKLDAYPEIRSWFLKERPKKEQNTELLQAQIKEAGASILTLRTIQIKPEHLKHRSFGSVSRCPLCGDYHPAAFGGICRSCQGQSPYEDGPGFSAQTQPAAPRPVAVAVADAVGKHALHDMTRIIPGEEKGPAFTAGQEFTAGDICRLQQMGRNRVYVLENNTHLQDWIHEDDAARGFARLMQGEGVALEAEPREGKVNFRAAQDGMLLVDTERLERFNLVPDVMCCTRHQYSVLTAGTRLAGSRAIPLYLSKAGFQNALAVLEDGPLFRIAPLRKAQVGILVTGTEVFQGLIQDRFAPIITQKCQQLQCNVVKTLIAPDKAEAITQGVHDLLAAGADLIITTAGLSVDPDDVTRKGLLDAGLADALYGVPALPGTMTLMGRIN